MTVEDFQNEHGRQWHQVLNLPSTSSAFILLSLKRMAEIESLTDEQIRNDSAIILSDIRGWMRHERALLELPIMLEADPLSIEEEYVDPIQENHEEQIRRHNGNRRT